MPEDDPLKRARMARIPREKKPPKPIPKFSKKRIAKMEDEKKLLSSEGDTLLQQYYKNQRSHMTGVCQCGCGEASQKEDNKFFRGSIARIFPKGKDLSGEVQFESVKYHPLNWVERRLWAGTAGTPACHTMMDEGSMYKWPNFADWDDIKAKFKILEQLLTPEEKTKKFYLQLKKLVDEN